MDQWLDWSAFGFLALLTLLDGLRRVPAGALVLRKIVGGRWQVVAMGEGYRVVSWWPPLTTTLTLIAAPAPGRTGGQAVRRPGAMEADLRSVRPRVLVLNTFGFLSLVALVVVVPVAMRWWGGMGFLSALLAVLVLSWLVTGLSFHFSKPLQLTTRQRIMFALPRLNPFAAPAAGEALLERTLSDSEPVLVAKQLMDEEEFAHWIRPMAYDVVAGADPARPELVRAIGQKELKAIVASRPARIAANSPWCPRCGAEFGPASTQCPSCEVPLRGMRGE